MGASLRLLALLAIGGAAFLGTGVPGVAEEGREVWTFEREGLARELDVTDMDAQVRARLVRRLGDAGFVRVRTGRRDLRADVTTLVAHGGRFPSSAAEAAPVAGVDLAELLARLARRLAELRATPDAGAAEMAAARARLAPRAAVGDAEGRSLGRLLAALVDPGRALAPGPSLLGAHVRLGDEGAVVLQVPLFSLAAAAGLAVGDVVLELDGLPAEGRTLARWERSTGWVGQRRLVVRRRSGEVEDWVLCRERSGADQAASTRR